MPLKKTLVASLLACVSSSVLAASGFVVDAIQFKGLQRISVQKIQQDIDFTKGETLTTAKSNALIQQLYSTGYFNDIQLFQNGHTLVVKVQERPTIGKIDIKGNSAIKTKQLKQVLLQAGIQVGNMLDKTTLNQVKQSLEQAYYGMGRYAVRVKLELKPMPRNRVAVDLHISEGLSAKITRIGFVGNKAFSNDTLADQLTVTTPGLFTFITGKDVFSKAKMAKSLQDLSNYYMDRGYINFHVDSYQVALASAKRKILLTINLSEGQKFDFSGYKLEGRLILPTAKMDSMVHIKKGETFSRQTVIDAAKAMTTALGNKGYAYANINPVPTIDKKTHTVFITFYINPGKKVYVRHINFSGNTVTNDKVLRQQMRFVEGSQFNLSKVNNSKTFVRRAYPFITDIKDVLKPVPKTSNQVDVDYKVHERTANTVSANLGFSDLDGIIVGGNLNMPNLFGTGNIFSIGGSVSRPVQSVNMNYTEPFFTQDGVQQSIGVYWQRVDNQYRDLIDYSTNSVGGTLNYAIPVTGVDWVNFGGGYDNTNLVQPQNDTSLTVAQFVKDNGNNFNTFTANLGLSHNSTNTAYFPTAGWKSNLTGKVAVPGSTMEWYKILAGATYYHPVWGKTSFSIGGHVNFGNGYGNSGQLPLFENFYGGGWGSVRGFSQGEMGPQDKVCTGGTLANPTGCSQGQAIGGNLEVDASLNYYFPVPFTHYNPKFRMGLFVDMGNVYDTHKMNTVWDSANQPTSPNFGNLRYSVGLSFQWISPLGPLAFSLAAPLNKKPGDQTQIFQFTLGKTF